MLNTAFNVPFFSLNFVMHINKFNPVFPHLGHIDKNRHKLSHKDIEKCINVFTCIIYLLYLFIVCIMSLHKYMPLLDLLQIFVCLALGKELWLIFQLIFLWKHGKHSSLLTDYQLMFKLILICWCSHTRYRSYWLYFWICCFTVMMWSLLCPKG